MYARLSNRYLEGLSRQGQLMVQMLAMSAEGLVRNARRTRAAGANPEGESFSAVVKHLLVQRHLAAEILENELQQSEFDFETAMLQTVLEDLCRSAEQAALGVQADLARQAGDHALARRIMDYLENGLARAELLSEAAA
jgi:hypothetical protein